MTDEKTRTPLEAQMHELAEKIAAMPDEQKQKLNLFLTGYLAALENIVGNQSA